MRINWYPGHMHKAGKELKQLLPKIDLVIEVVDARIPFSSQNPMLENLRGKKPCIKILNKSDLADPDTTALWQAYLERDSAVKTLALDTDKSDKSPLLLDLCRELVPDKIDSVHPINCLIMGIPNVGKSTLINCLAGRIIAKTGNEPAVTKSQQRINLHNGVVLFDTPGMLWPKIEHIDSGYRLAITGAIKDTALEYTDIAFYAAKFLLDNYADFLLARYKLQTLPESELELLETLGRQRGCLRAGGHVDLEQISTRLIHEFRSATIGRISLETPEMVEKELTELLEKQRLENEKTERCKNTKNKSRADADKKPKRQEKVKR
ncbi:MAG: ribosome biogenesis GTPase YlqF [Candidatus Reddybacter sp.]